MQRVVDQQAGAADPRAKTQQSIRLYDRQWRILDRWAEKLSPGMKPDRSALIREILEMTEVDLELSLDELRRRKLK